MLVIRAWLDARGGEGFRARITQVSDVSTPDAIESVASSEGDVLEAVRDWLRLVARTS